MNLIEIKSAKFQLYKYGIYKIYSFVEFYGMGFLSKQQKFFLLNLYFLFYRHLAHLLTYDLKILHIQLLSGDGQWNLWMEAKISFLVLGNPTVVDNFSESDSLGFGLQHTPDEVLDVVTHVTRSQES